MEDQKKKDLLKLNVGTQGTGEIIWIILKKKKKKRKDLKTRWFALKMFTEYSVRYLDSSFYF